MSKLSEKARELYAKNRRDGMPAKSALQYARYLTAPVPFDVDLTTVDRWRVFPHRDKLGRMTGFTIKAKLVCDESPDTSWLGEFTDKPDGAVKRPNARSGEYHYVKPATSEAEHYSGLVALHYGKSEARELARRYVRQDIAKLESLTSGDACLFGVVVQCSRKGVELGAASLWGIDDAFPTLPYVMRDVLPELVAESVSEARAAIARLVPGDTEEESAA